MGRRGKGGGGTEQGEDRRRKPGLPDGPPLSPRDGLELAPFDEDANSGDSFKKESIDAIRGIRSSFVSISYAHLGVSHTELGHPQLQWLKNPRSGHLLLPYRPQPSVGSHANDTRYRSKGRSRWSSDSKGCSRWSPDFPIFGAPGLGSERSTGCQGAFLRLLAVAYPMPQRFSEEACVSSTQIESTSPLGSLA